MAEQSECKELSIEDEDLISESLIKQFVNTGLTWLMFCSIKRKRCWFIKFSMLTPMCLSIYHIAGRWPDEEWQPVRPWQSRLQPAQYESRPRHNAPSTHPLVPLSAAICPSPHQLCGFVWYPKTPKRLYQATPISFAVLWIIIMNNIVDRISWQVLICVDKLLSCVKEQFRYALQSLT